jgi:PAS domain S-box-containing protein
MIGFLLCAAMTVIVGAVAVMFLERSNDASIATLDIDIAEKVLIDQLEIDLTSLRRYEKEFFLFSEMGNKARQEEYLAKLNSGWMMLSEDIGALSTLPPDAEPIEHTDELQSLTEGTYEKLTAVMNLMVTGTSYAGAQPEYQAYRDSVHELEDIVTHMSEHSTELMQDRQRILLDTQTTLSLLITVTVVVALITAVLLGVFITRSITSPLRRLQEMTRKIAAGDLAQRADATSTDEIGELAASFNHMTSSLQESEAELHKKNEVLVALNSELLETNESLQSEVEERRRAEDLFRTLCDSSPVGIFMVADGKYQFVNPQFQKYTGYSEDELKGMDSLSLVAPEDRRHVRNNAVDMLKGMHAPPYEYRLISKAGEVRWIMETVASTRYHDERVALGYVIDITSRKLAEEALLETEEQLRQSQKMEAIGRLAGGVAHDFNNLLTVITVCSDILMTDIGEGGPNYEDVVEIRKSAERAAMLTQQLLAFSRKQVLEAKVLDLNDVCYETEKMLRRLVGEDCQLDTVFEPQLDMVKVDPGSIEQVLVNLVVNARDAMPAGGKVTVTTENLSLGEADSLGIVGARPGRFVRLSVSDTGTGMSREVMEHIMEPFFTTKGQGKGTGLGLSTVYGIVKQNGGWVNVYSEPGQGTTFRFYFPAISTHERGEQGDSGNGGLATHLSGHGERILLVEDEESIRNIAQRLLTDSGYNVLSAESVGEALAIFDGEDGDFQLVVSDVVLADGYGTELVGQLRTINPKLRVMLSSGYADEKAQWPIIHEKGYPFLQKPYTTGKLLAGVKSCLATAEGWSGPTSQSSA